MSVTIDPTSPTDSASPTLGAQDIRQLTAQVQEMFGGAGSSAVTYAIPPFNTDISTGLSVVPGNAVAPLGIVTLQQLQANSSYTGVASGTNTYAVTFAVVPASYAAIQGIPLLVQFANGNTGASTLNVNSLGPVALVKNSNLALSGGDIPAGSYVTLTYDGTNIQIIGGLGTVALTTL